MPGQFVDSIINENLKVATEYFKATASDLEKNPDSGGIIGFIPFKMSCILDGISGIKIYNELNVNTNFLPNGYTKTTKFIVTGVDHKLSNGDWETSLNLTLIPNASNIGIITREIVLATRTKEVKKVEIILAPIDNGVGNVTLTTSEAFNDTLLWMYMIHQQGPDGSVQLYEIWKGKRDKWKPNVPIGNLIKFGDDKGNWPTGYEWDGFSANDGYDAYYGKGKGTQAMATAFIGVWTKMMPKKRESALKLINSNGKNCSGLSYKDTMMPAFRNAIQKVQEENPTWEVFDAMILATIADIENGLKNNTKTSKRYQGMFQQDKKNATYAAILRKYNDGTPTPACSTAELKNIFQTQYGVTNFEGYVLESFRIIMKNWEDFKKKVNWEGN